MGGIKKCSIHRHKSEMCLFRGVSGNKNAWAPNCVYSLLLEDVPRFYLLLFHTASRGSGYYLLKCSTRKLN